MSTGLEHRTRTAIGWSFAEAVSRQTLQFVIALVLARLLIPSEFGGFAVISLIITLAGYFYDAGLGHALIQKRELAPCDASSVLGFNILSSLLVTIALFLLGTRILQAFKQELLLPYLNVMLLCVPLTAMQSAHKALLTRALKFKELGLIALISTLVSSLLAILLAMQGFGIWSLVCQAIVANLLSAALMLYVSPPIPVTRFSAHSLRSLFKFGGWIALGSVLNAVKGGLLTFLLSRAFGLRALGLYNRAEGLRNMPQALLVASVERVLLPVFSESVSDRSQLRLAVQKVSESSTFVATGALLGLASVSHLIIPLLYGQEWEESAKYLSVLCYAGVFFPISMVNVQAMLALGHARRFFLLDFLKAIFTILMFAVSFRFGVMGLAIAQIPIAVFSWVVNTTTAKRDMDFGLFEQTKLIGPILISGAMASVVSTIFNVSISLPAVANIVVILSVWCATYVLLCQIFARALVSRLIIVFCNHMRSR